MLQGIVSGINAARHSDGKSLIVLERESSYIGTLIDDLVTKDLREPYRMLTRYRLSVQQLLVLMLKWSDGKNIVAGSYILRQSSAT